MSSAVENLDNEMSKFLSFRMGTENYGVGILSIKEIIEYVGVTDIPMMPNFVRGAINLRGKVVPVMDLAVRLGRKSQEVNKRTCVVIVEILSDGHQIDIGIMVDAVNEVLDIRPSDIDPAPSFGGALRTDFLRGMGKIGGKFLIILDIENILTLEDLETLNQAADKQFFESESDSQESNQDNTSNE